MSVHHRSRFHRIAVVASGAMLLLGGVATAQTVRVFDDAPSVEQLRNILAPESNTSHPRSIVIMRPDANASPVAVQRASIRVQSAPRTDVGSQDLPSQPVVKAAATVPMASRPAPRQESSASAVAFHINFAFDSATLPESAQQMIGRMAEFMKGSPDVNIRVEGHTDAAGAPGYNMSLSKRRALSVADYLVEQGIDPARLLPVGKGMAEPLASDPFDGANRRVQFVRAG
jgi:outer membrane protein OmpA-like peptidoglycan-associated protein